MVSTVYATTTHTDHLIHKPQSATRGDLSRLLIALGQELCEELSLVLTHAARFLVSAGFEISKTTKAQLLYL